ncbi:MAG: galactokinase [Alphaproteobacteria bacterium]|nr:galactokinase [Alphaproteobacteria bacterium]MDE2631206.1 galactokinase [Alphaproteobacteria bacterium]
MIIVRSPLRISLGGGGTDIPSYYREHEGWLISAAIDKYVYITLHHGFTDDMLVRYSKLERVISVEALEHPVIREAIKLVDVDCRGLEITNMSDIPSDTGLGSTGSFTTALLKALHILKHNNVQREELARQGCEIEIERLGEPIGKQDHYIAAFGGITCFRFCKDDRVESWPAPISAEIRDNLEDSLAMFFTGYAHNVASILKEQDDRMRHGDDEMFKNLHFVKDIGKRSLEALQSGYLSDFGKLMDEHWQYKKRRSPAMSNSKIDEIYELAILNGATGGKLIGAGGGGFLLFHAKDKPRLRRAMIASGLREVRFRFDFEGTKVLVQ